MVILKFWGRKISNMVAERKCALHLLDGRHYVQRRPRWTGGVFERARQAASGNTEEVVKEERGKRAKGVDGRSRSPLIGKFRTKIQSKRVDKSPMVTPKVKPRAAPTTTVEPPPGMEGMWNRDGKRKVDGSPSTGMNGGVGMGSSNGGGVTREEVYGLAWGLMQGWKGNGKGGIVLHADSNHGLKLGT